MTERQWVSTPHAGALGLTIGLSLLWAAGAATAQPRAVPAPNRVLVLEGGTLIDGTGRPPVADVVIVTEGARIKAVGTKGQIAYPPGATVLRLNGRTILPGLIDGHVHLRDYQVPMFLPYGVTTIADIHNDTEWSIAQRDALNSGRIKGPRMFVSGARVTGPLGQPTTDGSYVRTPDEARAYVRRLKAAGVDHVKVDLTITDDQLRAVIEESNAVGLRVLGHTQNIRKAVEMGFKHMEHTDTMARALLEQAGQPVPTGASPEALVDPKLFPPLVDYLVKQGVYVNPTLYLVWGGSTERWRDWTAAAAQIAKDPGLTFVPAEAKAAWVRPPRARDGYANAAEFLRQYSAAGGKIVAATDTGCCEQIVPGLSLHYEMQMLTDLGVPPMKAIQGATLWAAEVIGREKDLGSVEPGKLADFTIVEGNPLTDIGATKNVRMVIKNGVVIDTAYDPKWVNPIPRTPRTGLRVQPDAGEWHYYHADAGGSKYSPLDLINATNVARLHVAWRRPALDPALKASVPGLTASNYYRTTPLMIGGRLFVQNGLGFVEELDAGSGRAVWTQKPLQPGLDGLTGASPSRGIAYWRAGDDERLFSVRGNRLFALNAKTGAPVAAFGENGAVDLRMGVGPDRAYAWSGSPVVVKDVVILGSSLSDRPMKKTAVPGDVRAFDVRTGRLRWTFHVIPHPGEFGRDSWGGDSAEYTGAANMWTSPSADPELGYVYLPLSSPTNDYYGGHRPGDNLFSDSLVCVDATSGKRVWHFQTVHHDVWDYDLPAAPILGDITVNGRRVKAVVQLTKQGFAFVFDRVTGQPVWPIEERAVPQSKVPGEKTSPTQPFPTKPPPFARQGMSVDDLIDFTPALRAEARTIAEPYSYGPLFTPPSELGVDGKKGVFQLPSFVGGSDWNGGAFDPETGALYVPSIDAPIMSVLAAPDPAQSDFRYIDPTPGFPSRHVAGPQGLPLLKPPYGTITKIDLNRGTIDWTVPNGDGPRDHPLLKGLNLPPLGQPGRGSPLLTKSLLFVGEGSGLVAVNPPGGGGNVFRAYDKSTGAVLWSIDLGAGTTGSPMTYAINGRQYVVVAIGSADHPAELIALTLE